MADMWKIPVKWDGVTGLPGYSVFYGAPAGSLVTDLKTFFNAIKALFPASLTWQIPVTGDTIDDASGHVVGGWADAGGGTVTSTGSGIWAAGTGVGVRWSTNAIVNNRRLKGRTFLCPLFGSAYQSDGTILDAYVTTLQTAADALIVGADLLIWHRPPVGTFSGGESHNVIAAQVEDRVVSLRSRRF